MSHFDNFLTIDHIMTNRTYERKQYFAIPVINGYRKILLYIFQLDLTKGGKTLLQSVYTVGAFCLTLTKMVSCHQVSSSGLSRLFPGSGYFDPAAQTLASNAAPSITSSSCPMCQIQGYFNRVHYKFKN